MQATRKLKIVNNQRPRKYPNLLKSHVGERGSRLEVDFAPF